MDGNCLHCSPISDSTWFSTKRRLSLSHPTVAEKTPVPSEAATSDLVAETVQALHDLLHSIALPKTAKAKSCSIPLEMLLTVQHLISGVCTSTQQHLHSPSFSTIIQELDEISACVSPTQPTMKTHTYVSILASKVAPAALPLPSIAPTPR